jgi:hypothetical protein
MENASPNRKGPRQLIAFRDFVDSGLVWAMRSPTLKRLRANFCCLLSQRRPLSPWNGRQKPERVLPNSRGQSPLCGSWFGARQAHLDHEAPAFGGCFRPPTRQIFPTGTPGAQASSVRSFFGELFGFFACATWSAVTGAQLRPFKGRQCPVVANSR